MKTIQLTNQQMELISRALSIAENTYVSEFIKYQDTDREKAIKFYKDAEQFSEFDSLFCMGEFNIKL
jgi:hypothetical protein